MSRAPRKHQRAARPAAKNKSKSRVRLTAAKKLLFSAAVTVSFFVMLELALAVAGWKPLADEEDPYVGFFSINPLFEESVTSGGEHRLITVKSKLRWFNHQEIPKSKAKDSYRIFCLGGSTTYGRPYDDATSFSGWLRQFLSEMDDARTWEVVNVGGISYASYRVANIMKEVLDYSPDLFIVYSGHNEFLEARTYGDSKETPEVVVRLVSACSRTRTFAVMSRLLTGSNESAGPADPRNDKYLMASEVNTLLDSAIGPEAYHRDDQLRQDIVQHYEFNLRRMIGMAKNAGVPLILVTPASNLSHCSPFKSEHRSDMEAADLRRWEAFYSRAQQRFAAGDLTEALRSIEQAVRIDPQHAATVFLRGQIRLAQNDSHEAKRDFATARDEDVCTLRAPAEMLEVVRRLAGEMHVPLVDFAAQVNDESPEGIAGENLFLDHVHPTIEGNRELAISLVSSMRDVGAIQPQDRLSVDMVAAVTDRVMSQVDSARNGAALRNLSKVLSWAGKKVEADRIALRAVELIPDDAEAQYQAGNAFLRQGKIDEAIRRYERVHELNPEYAASVHASLGYAFAEKGDEEEAVRHYQRCLQINPGYADIRYNLATIYERRGGLDAAQREYEKAISGNPNHFAAQHRLGVVFARQGKWDEARTQFNRALRIAPNSVDARLDLGQALIRQGDIASARECFRAVLRRIPDHPLALAELQKLN